MKQVQIGLSRAYDPPGDADGPRFLVDRVWPRGLTRNQLQIEQWLREAAPSPELRRWFGHDLPRWEEFVMRYRAELDANPAAWQPLVDVAHHGAVTLVFGARDREHNQAVVLREYIAEKLARR